MLCDCGECIKEKECRSVAKYAYGCCYNAIPIAKESKMEKFWNTIEAGKDAILYCGDCVEILYLNEQANNGNGSFEIIYVEKQDILALLEERGEPKNEDDANDFLDALLSGGKGYYCDNTKEAKEEFDHIAYEEYPNADFITGRDGGIEEELQFLVNWATKKY